MIDERDLFERAAQRFDPPTDAFERFTRRRERRRRNQRVGAAVVAIAIVVIGVGSLVWSVRNPAKPVPANPPDAFAGVHGWIAMGGTSRIIAVNPDDPKQHAVLSDKGGLPLTWSADGSELLILRGKDLVVLKADGTQTSVASFGGRDQPGGGSFSPDGSAVVYMDKWSIEAADVASSTVRTIASGNVHAYKGYLLPFYRGGQLSRDGILAYQAIGDRSASIWLMNGADGSDQHKLVSTAPFSDLFGNVGLESIYPLAWSPDGSRLLITAVSNKLRNGSVTCATYVIGADGSGLARITSEHVCLWSATWSPDGTQIGGNAHGRLVTMKVDGTDVQEVPLPAGSTTDPASFNTAWNPVP